MNDFPIAENAKTMIDDALTITRIRIRFAGTEDSENFHLSAAECMRLHSDWKSFLAGNGPRGGEYYRHDGENPVLMALNFDHIVYTEPGKIY